jgi:lipoprotein-anchoring transpeptidase ErfK/SrfK
MIEEIGRSDRKRRSRILGSTRRLAKLWAQRATPRCYAIGLYVAQSFGCALAAATIVLPLENVALADPLAFVGPSQHQSTIFDRVFRDQRRGPDTTKDSAGPANVVAGHRGQLVSFSTGEVPGTIIIDTPNTSLYFIMGGGKAVRYGIGVGREGFTWSGVETITRKAEWPDWSPPAEMLARQPYLPRVMAGGPGNPLGARAMYLGDTAYRIHGTNQPDTIGRHVSSGCIRMLNDDVIDLYSRVNVGTKVIVLPNERHRAFDATAGNPSAANREHHASLY